MNGSNSMGKEYAVMAPEEIQALADADEADAAVRYARRQEFSLLLADAIRRAEARTRLECALRRPTDQLTEQPTKR